MPVAAEKIQAVAAFLSNPNVFPQHQHFSRGDCSKAQERTTGPRFASEVIRAFYRNGIPSWGEFLI